MPHYRTYVLGRTGNIIAGDDLSAENDQEAVTTAWQRLERYNETDPYQGCGVEVWNGRRPVFSSLAAQAQCHQQRAAA